MHNSLSSQVPMDLSVVYTFTTFSGLLQSIGQTVVKFELWQNVALHVNIASSEFAQRYLRALTWYHDGNQVNNERITLSSDNTTLKINEISEADAGIYEAMFAGLLIHPYNEFCEQETLSLLRHYPVLAPVTFYVQTNGKALSLLII